MYKLKTIGLHNVLLIEIWLNRSVENQVIRLQQPKILHMIKTWNKETQYMCEEWDTPYHTALLEGIQVLIINWQPISWKTKLVQQITVI